MFGSVMIIACKAVCRCCMYMCLMLAFMRIAHIHIINYILAMLRWGMKIIMRKEMLMIEILG